MRGVLLISCITFACAHQARQPPLGGWQELRSEHFRLQTDLSPSASRVTLQRLETLRSALQTAWIVREGTPHTAVVVLRVQANLVAAVGRCEEALETARRAWGVLPHRAPPELVDAVERDLDLIRGSCSHVQAPAR